MVGKRSRFAFAFLIAILLISMEYLVDSPFDSDVTAADSDDVTDCSFAPSVLLIESNPDKISMNIQSDGFMKEVSPAADFEFDRIRIKDCFNIDKTGYPELPYIRKLIAIPECSEVNLKIEYEDTTIIDDLKVCPAPEYIRENDFSGGFFREVFDKKEESIYTSDEYYPEKLAEVKDIFKIRNQRVAEVYIYPLRFNPVQKRGIFYHDIDVKLEIKDPQGSVSVDNGPFSKICENILLNYQSIGFYSSNQRNLYGSGSGSVDSCNSLSEVISNDTDYLIIMGNGLWADDTIATYIDMFANKRKNFNGFDVSLIDINNIIDNIEAEDAADSLKSKLVEMYNSTWPDDKLQYILLFGDGYDCSDENCTDYTTILPVYYKGTMTINHEGETVIFAIPSDFLYAALDSEDDISPDVFIGRISVDDSFEAKSFLSKIINYEPHTKVDTLSYPWHKRTLFVGGAWDQEFGDIRDVGLECSAVTPAGFEYNEFYNKNHFDTNGVMINNEINDGILFVCEGGHGNAYAWSGGVGREVYFPKYYEILDNEDMYPIVFAASCETAHYDKPNWVYGVHPNSLLPQSHSYYGPAAPAEVDSFDCMGERLTNIAGRGAVAYIGWALYTYTPNLSSRTAGFYEEFFNGYYSIGEMLNSYYFLYPNNHEYLTLLGDPALNPFYEVYPDSSNYMPDLCFGNKGFELDKLISDLNEGVSFSIKIRNSGNGNASNIPVMLKLDGDSVCINSIYFLNSYEDTTLNLNLSVNKVGTHELQMIINPDSIISEFNYWNNQIDTIVSVMDIKEGFPVELDAFPQRTFPCTYNMSESALDMEKEIFIKDIGDPIYGTGNYLRSIDYNGNKLGCTLNLNLDYIFPILIGKVREQCSGDVVIVSKINTSDTEVLISLYNTSLNYINENLVPLSETDDYRKCCWQYSSLYDIDKDGYQEILYIDGFHDKEFPPSPDYSYPGELAKIDYIDGMFIKKDSLILDYAPKRFAVEDINFDNNAEIVIIGLKGKPSEDITDTFSSVLGIYSYSNNFELEENYSYETIVPDDIDSDDYKNVFCKIAIDDVTGDQYQDIIGCMNNHLVIINDPNPSDATVEFDTFATGTFGSDSGWYSYTNLCTAEISSVSSGKEIIMCDNRSIRILSASDMSGIAIIDSTRLNEYYNIHCGPYAADLDSDGLVEIIVGAEHVESVNTHDCGYYEIFIYDHQLEQESQWHDVRLYGCDKGNITIDDIDLDGSYDIIFQSFNPSYLYVFNTPWPSGGECSWGYEYGNIRATNCSRRYIKGDFNENVSLTGYVIALGDVSSDTLFIGPGTDIKINDEDEEESGDDISKVELICRRGIQANGLVNNGITFESMAESPGPGDWVGILCDTSSSDNYLGNCTIRNSETAIKSYGPIELKNCYIDSTNAAAWRFYDNALIDSSEICLVSDAVVLNDDSLTITGNSKFRISPEDTSDYMCDSLRISFVVLGDLVINGDDNDRVEFTTYGSDTAASWHGIHLTGDSASCVMRDCDISNAYYGLSSNTTVDMRNVSVSNCDPVGVYLYEGDGDSNASFIKGCNISNNDNVDALGLYIWDVTDTVVVDSCTMNNNFGAIKITNSSPKIKRTNINYSDNVGIWVSEYQCSLTVAPIIRSCKIRGSGGNGIGFKGTDGTVCYTKIWDGDCSGIYSENSDAEPEIHHSKIIDNEVSGIMAALDSEPLLGDASLADSIHSNNTIINDLANVYQTGTVKPTIMAENCWWGNGEGEVPNSRLFKGNVDFFPFLTSDPVVYLYRDADGAGGSKATRLYMSQNYPNPLVGSNHTTIRYSVPARQLIRINIYDVTGRKIKELVNRTHSPGHYQAIWNGRNDRGAEVASGIYFYQMVAGRKKISKKIIILK